MKHFTATLYLAIFSTSLLSTASAAKPGPKSDFVSAPGLSRSEVAGQLAIEKGDLRISYRNGVMTDVTIARSSGNPKLDQIVRKHVLLTYKVRPGTSGTVDQSFDFTGDFISTPAVQMPYRYHDLLRTGKVGHMLIVYKNGQITEVRPLDSCGSAVVDELIARHIAKNFKVKKGATGTGVLPIRVH